MSLIKRLGILIFLGFLCGLFLWALYGPKNSLELTVSRTLEEQKNKADVFFSEVIFSESEGENKFWELKAQKASLNKSTGKAFLTEIEGLFFSQGKPTLKFIAPQAKWDMKKKDILLINPIGFDPRSKIKKSYWFKCQELNWNTEQQKINGQKDIIFSQNNATIYAQNLMGDLDFKTVSLFDYPLAIIKLKSKGTISLEAKTFLMDKNEIQAREEVKVAIHDKNTPKTKITAQTADYKINNNEILFKGQVQIFYPDAFASAHTAAYFPNTQKINLKGSAVASYGKNKLNGENIIILLKERKIKLQGRTKVNIRDKELIP